jgi:hemoglobin
MASLLTVGLAGPSRAADDKPAAGVAPSDQRLVSVLRDVINRGVDIFNPPSMGGRGDHNGCYRLFQGALMVARAELDQHPDLQKEIDAGLKDAERLATPGERAHALRRVIDNTRMKLDPSLKKVAETKPAGGTLWDRLGGEPNVRKVVDDFVALAATDPKVDFTRGGKYKLDQKAVDHLKQTLVELISSLSGGPLKYTGRGMKEAHAGMGITDAQFDAIAADLQKALEKNGAKPADIAAVMSVVGSTRKDIVETKKPDEKKPDEKKPDEKKPTEAKAAATLWDRLGGEANVKKVVADFVTTVEADPKVDFTRSGKIKLDEKGVDHLKQMLVELISSVSGGPYKYSGRGMMEVHKGMGITDAQFDASVADLRKALEKNGAKADDIAAVLKVVEGTRKDIVEPTKKAPDKKPDAKKESVPAKDK